MLTTAQSFRDRLDNGRRLTLGSETVRNPAHHLGLCPMVSRLAELYDWRAGAEHRGVLWHGDAPHERYATEYTPPRCEADLLQRSKAHALLADEVFGMLGRPPDHVSSFVTGLAMVPEMFSGQERSGFDENIVAFHRRAAREDLFLAYAVLPPAATRSVGRNDVDTVGITIEREGDNGLVLSGRKRLATGAAFCDAVWIGNLQPLQTAVSDEAVTAVIFTGSSGVRLQMRHPMVPDAARLSDYPLSAELDEGDAVLVLDKVKVPWEQVFVLRDAGKSRSIYTDTPAHVLGNHQSCVRFWRKLRLMVGVAHRLAESRALLDVSEVRAVLGKLAGLEAMANSMVVGQSANYQEVTGGVTYDPRGVYAFLSWAAEIYPQVVGALRDLSGSGPLEAASATDDGCIANEAYRLNRLLWDLVGSEFAGRQLHYERFFAGPPYVVQAHSYRTADWDMLLACADRAISPKGSS